MRQVVGLIKRIHARLPISHPFGAHMADDIHFLDFVIFNISLRQANPLLRGGALPSMLMKIKPPIVSQRISVRPGRCAIKSAS